MRHEPILSARHAVRDPDGRLAYRNQGLSGRVPLDGGRFERCHFKNAVLVYSGGEPPILDGCRFEATAFEFDGPAGETLAFLKALASPGSGLRDVFKASFPAVFGH